MRETHRSSGNLSSSIFNIGQFLAMHGMPPPAPLQSQLRDPTGGEFEPLCRLFASVPLG
jgi:hypothetical protein